MYTLLYFLISFILKECLFLSNFAQGYSVFSCTLLLWFEHFFFKKQHQIYLPFVVYLPCLYKTIFDAACKGRSLHIAHSLRSYAIFADVKGISLVLFLGIPRCNVMQLRQPCCNVQMVFLNQKQYFCYTLSHSASLTMRCRQQHYNIGNREEI